MVSGSVVADSEPLGCNKESLIGIFVLGLSAMMPQFFSEAYLSAAARFSFNGQASLLGYAWVVKFGAGITSEVNDSWIIAITDVTSLTGGAIVINPRWVNGCL